jgi:hypothetical protein
MHSSARIRHPDRYLCSQNAMTYVLHGWLERLSWTLNYMMAQALLPFRDDSVEQIMSIAIWDRDPTPIMI